MENRTQTARSLDDPQVVIRSLDQLSYDAKIISDRVIALETIEATKNLEQPNIALSAYSAATISGLYTQAEVQQLSTDIKTLSDKLDILITSLITSNLLKTGT